MRANATPHIDFLAMTLAHACLNTLTYEASRGRPAVNQGPETKRPPARVGYAPEAGKQNVGDQSFALLRTLPCKRDYGGEPQTFRLTTKKCVRGQTRRPSRRTSTKAAHLRPIRLNATNDIHTTYACNSLAFGRKHLNRAPFIL